MSILPTIKSPADTRKLPIEKLVELADEVRHEIVSAVSRTGGHLASNLGTVELTIALHHVFDLPTDKIIWDVSHQVYAHKILTGRADQIHTIRQYNGLSGFAKRGESEYDDYGAGHASTSISAALGFATARDMAGKRHQVVAVIGDGSMTGGLAFEGLNNAGSLKKDMLVILNDNTWSISKNVGAISKYLTSIMADETFNRIRDEIWQLTGRFKRRESIRATISSIEKSVHSLLVPGMLFQKLGFRYFGPIDGHDLPLLVRTLQDLIHIKGPKMLHIATVKGKGYVPAENDAFKYHGVGKFDKVTGELDAKSPSRPAYTNVFGEVMIELAKSDERVVAITAAMTSGTGLVKFADVFPDRFFDVGIAEGHAGCFAAGLAAEGMKPYLTVYSTFMQRAYDQVIHDIALQNLPVVICMDRGGLVGNDGPTHHGAFDLSYMGAVPNFTIAVPKDGNEMRAMMHHTVTHDLDGPVVIRFPRDNVPAEMRAEIDRIEWGRWEYGEMTAPVALIANGPMYTTACEVAERLAGEGVPVDVVNGRFVKPLDETALNEIRKSAALVITIEENVIRGGFGQAVSDHLSRSGFSGRVHVIGLPDRFVTHGNRDQLLKEIRLDFDGVLEQVRDAIDAMAGNGSREPWSPRLVMTRAPEPLHEAKAVAGVKKRKADLS